MKHFFYCMLAVSIMAITLSGCKSQSSQEQLFKGEWAYTKPDPGTDPDGPVDLTTDYYVNLDLYKKNDIVESFCYNKSDVEHLNSYYGLFQAMSEVEGTELAIDSILYLSVDSASVLAFALEYPEEPHFKLQFKYADKDSSLTVNVMYPNGNVVRETLQKKDDKKGN